MKKIGIILVFILASFITSQLNSQPCLPNGIYFETQDEINSFPINFPNCTQIEGNVVIGFWNGSNISNLDSLSSLTSIVGDLELRHNNLLPDLYGLHNLDSIFGSLFVGGENPYWGNDLLYDLSGLTSLNFIGNDLIILGNQNLVTLDGLENLTTIAGGTIFIDNNDSLNSLRGLDSLNTEGLFIRIHGNHALVNLTGLECSTAMGGFNIGYNDGLLNLRGLENIQTIETSFSIVGNARLKNLSGLENLSHIDGDLSMNGNDSLSDISDLSNLTHLGGELSITVNDLINNLSGLESIDSEELDSLELRWNYSLSECEIQSICAYLKIPNNIADIRDNAPNCNSIEEIEEACESVDINEDFHEIEISIFPNPASDKITISGKNGLKVESVNIYNQLGQKVFHRNEIRENIDISTLGQGIYIIELTSRELKIRQKLIIEK